MKKSLVLIIFFCCLFRTAFCQQAYWQQQVNYKIDVTLNDSDNTLEGYVKMDYYNNSPDTLHFIWMQLWPNAYKNDRTAFSDQLLENGRTDFYFSNFDRRGYINRLDFKVNDITVKTEDHPQHQDIIKIILPQPLAPNSTIKIETPFHVKLPYNFDDNGYTKHSYQITQWYPKPEVYDSKGWHDIPYLSKGGSYNEFGNYDVQITVPVKYIVATNGSLKNDATITNNQTKTLRYEQNNLTDFVWFADKKFLVKHDTIQTQSGKIIDAFIYYKDDNTDKWNNSIKFLKDAITSKTKLIGEYPYNTISIVENTGNHNELFAYPGIATMRSTGNEKFLDFQITHLTGYSWFGGALAINERENLWMTKGFNIYNDDKYLEEKNETPLQIMDIKSKWIKNRLPDNPKKTLIETIAGIKKDQPIATRADSFSIYNYYVSGYFKTAEWLKQLEVDNIGTDKFNAAVKEYYQRWEFKHPTSEDFKKVIEETSGKNVDSSFALLNKKGNIYPVAQKKDIRFDFLFNLKDADKHNYIFVSPSLGYNFYDKLMIGVALHKYTLPFPKFEFLLTPLYATGSNHLNGFGRLSYNWYPGNIGEKIQLSIAGATFSDDSFTDSTGNTTNFRISKIVPSIKIVFGNKNPRSTVTKFIQWKTFFISEQGLLFQTDTITQVDKITYPTTNRYLNQLRFVIENNRKLYPYKGELQLEQGDGFMRAAFTGNYYFNYAKGGGVNVRLFAGKFFYLGDKTYLKEALTDAYHLNMTGPKGSEDYTYSNYYYGRNEFQGFASQQIMERDGFFKVRTDLLSAKIGKTDNWLSAVNFTTDIPKSINPLQILPIKIPLKAFLDVGTYAEAWQTNPPTGKLLYDAGLQLSLLKNIVNIYVPLFYSSVYSNYFQSTVTGSIFLQNISFSIDIQNITLRKLVPQLSF